MGVRGEVFSTKVALQNRTYFFNVKENRLGDLYLNIVESKNRDEGGFERQSVILFADDLQEFLRGFDESLKVLEKSVREKRRGKGAPSFNKDRDGGRESDRDSDRENYRDRDRDREGGRRPGRPSGYGRGPERKGDRPGRDSRQLRDGHPKGPKPYGRDRKDSGYGRDRSDSRDRDRDRDRNGDRNGDRKETFPRKKRVVVKKH